LCAGEENSKLLNRLEYLNEVDAQNKLIKSQMNEFKMEYAQKLNALRSLVHQGDSSSQPPIQAEVDDNSNKIGNNQKSDTTIIEASNNQRIHDLERTVKRLLGRLDAVCEILY
jgi:small-conductance mechanosensitive channel